MQSIKNDAGWNDPPKFSYCESVEYSKSSKRNQLNKRVAFPLQSSQPAISSSQAPIDPTSSPVFNTNLPPPPMSLVPSKHDNNSGQHDAKQLPNTSVPELSSDQVPVPDLIDVLESLTNIIDEKRDVLNASKKLDLVKKKFQVMEDAWKTNKLPDDVKRKLFELSDALKIKERIKADQIQISLMVDHPKLCSEFMPAFRQLINME